MAEHSGIEWTESTWNPLTGCTKVSPGCKHCYAERMSKRLQAMGQPNYRNGFKLTPARKRARKTARMEKATGHFRQLDERPVPQRCAGRVCARSFRCDEARALAYLPGA